MHPALEVTLFTLVALLTLWALAQAALNRSLPPALLGGFILAEILLVAQALLGLLDVLEGYDLADPVVTWAYALTSIAAFPVAQSAFPGEETRWKSAALAVAGLVILVVHWRLHATW